MFRRDGIPCPSLRKAALLAAAVVVFLLGGPSQAISVTRHIVLLYDERPELSGLAALDADFVRTLAAGSTERFEIYREGMDLSRFDTPAYRKELLNYLRSKYANRKIDVAVGVVGAAMNFLLEHGSGIFPGAAMVFCGIDRREFGERTPPANVHSVLVKREFAPTLELALGLHPQTRQAVVVAGTSEFDTRLLDQARNEFEAYKDRVTLTFMTGLPLPEILKSVSQLPPQSIVLFVTFFRDSAGEVFMPPEVAQRVSSAANAPTYGFLDTYLGHGIVGGSLYSFAAQGTEAAKITLKLLAGDPPAAVVEAQTGRALFDWRQLQRWGISERRLPLGSEVHFRDPSAWERYRAEILAVSSAVLLQAALILWLLYERHQRQRSEVEAHALSGRLINAQEEERSRLARELHDDVTQRLAVLAIQAGREERASPPGSAAGSVLPTIREGLARLSEDVHALSYRLHPSILEDLGLVEALKAECELHSQNCSIRLEVNAREIPERLPRDVALCLFRITQEALRNSARHARASQGEVNLRRLNRGLQLTVTDNGTGFDPEKPHTRTSLGHASMRQRAALLGGKVDIDSTPGRGTTIRAWVPVKEEGSEPFHRADG